MKPKRHDFWDGLDAVVRELDDESSKMAARGELDEFEREWHDPIAKLSERSWFVDAKAVAKKIAEDSIRIEVKNIIGYYRFAERLLDPDFA